MNSVPVPVSISCSSSAAITSKRYDLTPLWKNAKFSLTRPSRKIPPQKIPLFFPTQNGRMGVFLTYKSRLPRLSGVSINTWVIIARLSATMLADVNKHGNGNHSNIRRSCNPLEGRRFFPFFSREEPPWISRWPWCLLWSHKYRTWH